MAQEKSFPTELAPVTILHRCLSLTAEFGYCPESSLLAFSLLECYNPANGYSLQTFLLNCFKWMIYLRPCYHNIFCSLMKKVYKLLRECPWWPCLSGTYCVEVWVGGNWEGVSFVLPKYANEDKSCSQKRINSLVVEISFFNSKSMITQKEHPSPHRAKPEVNWMGGVPFGPFHRIPICPKSKPPNLMS